MADLVNMASIVVLSASLIVVARRQHRLDLWINLVARRVLKMENDLRRKGKQ
jgi:hypothetical protein